MGCNFGKIFQYFLCLISNKSTTKQQIKPPAAPVLTENRILENENYKSNYGSVNEAFKSEDADSFKLIAEQRGERTQTNDLKYKLKKSNSLSSPLLRRKFSEDACTSFFEEHCQKLYKPEEIELWAGYLKRESTDKNSVVLVVIVPHMPEEKEKVYRGMQVIYKIKDVASIQSQKAFAYPSKYTWAPGERRKVAEAIKKNSSNLMKKHGKLTIISGSPVRSKKNELQKEACIVLYVKVKGIIPLHEDPFPTSIDGVPVDIREGSFSLCPHGPECSSVPGFFKLTPDPNEYNTPLRIGCGIGVTGQDFAGTLGGFVDCNGTLHFLTCAHVAFPMEFPPQSFSYDGSNSNIFVQPADGDSSNWPKSTTRDRKCSKLIKAIFMKHNNTFVDAAIVKVEVPPERIPTHGLFSGLSRESLRVTGFSQENMPTFNTGEIIENIKETDMDKRLVKSGRGTLFTRGVFEFESMAVRCESHGLKLNEDDNQDVIVEGQYEIKQVGQRQFFQPGDSGSLVFMVENDPSENSTSLKCVGLAIGCTDYNSCIVTPIKPVLESLGLPLRLKVFGPEPMDIDDM